jgi:hypothetical protein
MRIEKLTFSFVIFRSHQIFYSGKEENPTFETIFAVLRGKGKSEGGVFLPSFK